MICSLLKIVKKHDIGDAVNSILITNLIIAFTSRHFLNHSIKISHHLIHTSNKPNQPHCLADLINLLNHFGKKTILAGNIVCTVCVFEKTVTLQYKYYQLINHNFLPYLIYLLHLDLQNTSITFYTYQISNKN